MVAGHFWEEQTAMLHVRQVTICLDKGTQPIDCPFRKRSSCGSLLLKPLEEREDSTAEEAA
jgi:hypothetical protein